MDDFNLPAVQTYETYEEDRGAFSAPTASSTAAKKVFVGSLPDGTPDYVIRDEFSKYGIVEDVFIKANTEPGRMWAFVTFASPEQAASAVSMTNGVLMFPGGVRPCEVTLARHQGMFGQDPLVSPAPSYQGYSQEDPSAAGMSDMQIAPRKIFVGSLPDTVSDPMLREEFSKYGQVVDLFIKTTCEPGRQWAFVTFANSEQAQFARNSCNKVLMFPGSERPCEVTMARHQGMFGKDPIEPKNPGVVPTNGSSYTAPVVEGPRKVFVGSLPDSITDQTLRLEFSKYGQIIDLFLKTTCEPGRQWAFITFATSEQAQYAKDSTDRILTFPGADRTCEVMLAKNQGKFGQAPLSSYGVGGSPAPAPAPMTHQPSFGGPQPPPPTTPPPAHLTPWRMYRTASGLPYYHNSTTGITQWECPPDFQVPGQPEALSTAVLQEAQGGMAYNGGGGGQQRYSPY